MTLKTVRPFACTLAALLFPGFVQAEPPAPEHLYPVAVRRGTAPAVAVSGNLDRWPPQVWAETPGITFKPQEKTGVFTVEVAGDAAPGPHLIRFFNESGASAPRLFIVSDRPETAEAEPNNSLRDPQRLVELPVSISGRLDRNGDVDSFAVPLRRGQTLDAALEGYVLGSGFDGMLRLADEAGGPLAFNHDGISLDPRLRWTAPHDGVFMVQVMGFAYPPGSSVSFTGGESCVYRLHLETVEGCVERKPEEPEPSGTEPLTPPFRISGRIEQADAEDRFVFAAEAQRIYEVAITAAKTGSPLDAWVKIQDSGGAELIRQDDTADSPDPRLTWTAPATGHYTVTAGDVTHRGGADFSYHLSVTEAAPSVSAAAAHSIRVAAGAEAEAKVTVKRANGFRGKLHLIAKGLPPGVSAAPAEVPEKDGEVTLKIQAAPEAAPANGPFELALSEVESGCEHPVLFHLTSAGESNGVPQGFQDLLIKSTPRLWLTVMPRQPAAAPPPSGKTE